MDMHKLMLLYIAVVLCQAEKNETEQTFFSRYPSMVMGVITGLSVVAILFTFCCCFLVIYLCVKVSTAEQGGPPSIIQTVADTLRRRTPPVLEAYPSQFSARHLTIEDHQYEHIRNTPSSPQPQQQPPRLPTTPRPTLNAKPSTSTAEPSTSRAAMSSPQPRMGMKAKVCPTPKKRGLKKKMPPPYVNLDPQLVAAEQILMNEADDQPNNVRASFKRMLSFRPNMWAHLDSHTVQSSNVSDISMKCFPDSKYTDEYSDITTEEDPPNSPNSEEEDDAVDETLC